MLSRVDFLVHTPRAARSAVRVDDDGFAPGEVTPPFGNEVRAILSWPGFSGADVERLLAGGVVTPKL
jgi:hypothetical protein